MSEFEIASLALAEKQYSLGVTSTIISAIAVLAAIWGAYIIYGQLKSARWMSLLTLEQDLASRRDKFVAIKDRLDKFPNDQSVIQEYGVLKESYLNSVDRLASSILNGNFPKKEMKQDYRDYISDVIRVLPNDYHTGTRYPKTVKLYQRWLD